MEGDDESEDEEDPNNFSEGAILFRDGICHELGCIVTEFEIVDESEERG